MEIIFMNTSNSKTNKSNRFVINLLINETLKILTKILH